MYGSYNPYNQQLNIDRINAQINELEKLKNQYQNITSPQQPTSINQTFQLAPTNTNGMKYVNTLDDVNKEIVYVDTPFFSKDMTVLWIKNNKNEVKTYELNEIEPKDEKDIKIDFLMAQIEELKKGIRKNESNDYVNEPITNTNESEEPSNVSNVSKSSKKSK